MRRLTIVALALALALAAACAAPPLRVASDLANPPFARVAEDGRPRGRDVAMMEEIGRRLGRPIEWRRVAFDGLLGALERGEADVVCATLGVTEERAERVLFTRPYFRTSIALVVRAAPVDLRAPPDFAGLRVHAAEGTTSEAAVRERLPRATLVLGAKEGATVAGRLAAGELDAAAMDRPAAEAVAAASESRLRVLSDPLAPEDYALALPLGADGLRDAIDEALAAIEAEGLAARWNAEHGLAEASRRP